jgi:predicted deacylase
MAGRLAHLFLQEVVLPSDLGIDFHTGSDHRTNFPQVRADLDDPETLLLAEAFAAPVMVHARALKGSLRGSACDAGIPNLMFEAGEARRFDTDSIIVGVRGVMRLLASLGMLEPEDPSPVPRSRVSRRGVWVRAGRGGLLRLDVALGDVVRKDDVLGAIYEPVGDKRLLVRARTGGMLIGMTNDPLVNRGEGILHIAELESG